ncbi:hypothetical protein PIB30_091219, partial [Stylosanthes scabra]|nr:hypothetical protein [Stylosanthes scabra]
LPSSSGNNSPSHVRSTAPPPTRLLLRRRRNVRRRKVEVFTIHGGRRLIKLFRGKLRRRPISVRWSLISVFRPEPPSVSPTSFLHHLVEEPISLFFRRRRPFPLLPSPIRTPTELGLRSSSLLWRLRSTVSALLRRRFRAGSVALTRPQLRPFFLGTLSVLVSHSLAAPPMLATTVSIQPVLSCFHVLNGPLCGPLHYPPAVARHHRLHLIGSALFLSAPRSSASYPPLFPIYGNRILV